MVQRLKDVLYLGPEEKLSQLKRGLLLQICEFIENPTDFALVDGKWSIFPTFLRTLLFLKLFDGAFYGLRLLFLLT